MSTHEMNKNLSRADGDRQAQRLMNVEIIVKIISSVIVLRIESSALPRAFDIAVVDIESQTNLQMCMNLRCSTLRHGVPDHLRASVHRFKCVRLLEPFLGQFE